MKALHIFKSTKDGVENGLVLLTQMLSVLRFKENHPNINFELYTDSNTLEHYREFGIDKLYDAINTDILDTYPTNRISPHFWASPKLWVMHHMTEPFCVMDTDLVYHKTIDKFYDYDYVYLHQESPINYGMPHKFESTNGFEFLDSELIAFSNVFPVNCAFMVHNNMEFLKKYTTRYFELVLDNDVKLIMDSYDARYVHKYAPQIIAEQWLLPMIADHVRMYEGMYINAKSMIDTIAFPNMFRPFQLDAYPDDILDILSDNIYHLWGAKTYYETGQYDDYERVKEDLHSAVTDAIEHNSLYHYKYVMDNILKSMPVVS